MADHRIARPNGPPSEGKSLPPSLRPGEVPTRPVRIHDGGAPGPRRVRPALRAPLDTFVRFIRLAEGIADDPEIETETKLHHLEALEVALVEGRARRPYVKPALDLRESLQAIGVGDQHARQMLQGFRRDAMGQVCRTWSDLLLYCRYTAAPYGRFVLDLCREDAAAAPASDALCAAAQILSCLQDCRSDWVDLGRCYIPLHWFNEAGVTPERLVETRCDPDLRSVFDRTLRQVDGLMLRAAVLPRQVKDRTLKIETAVMLREMRALRQRLARKDPLRHRVQLDAGVRLSARVRGAVAARLGR